jgi:AmiR/NasT family two-component response regulator
LEEMKEKARVNGGVPSSIFDRLAVLELENAQLRTALESRIIVEQAKGAISVRFGIAPDEAFEMMRGLARSQHREIHEYAAEIVANGGRFAVEN